MLQFFPPKIRKRVFGGKVLYKFKNKWHPHKCDQPPFHPGRFLDHLRVWGRWG
jgi:hypothetical protein